MKRAMCLLAAGLMAASAISTMTGCAGDDKSRYGAAETSLKLSRVVLYRNGVGYFERRGKVDGDVLTIRCRKDQINDVLKSLTVVDRSEGQAVSVSMPLDPQSWANAALSTLAPGSGNLPEVLDALRGTWIKVRAGQTSAQGRILMVEEIETDEGSTDHRIALLDEDVVKVVMASKIDTIAFEDGELALQLNRTLDASAGEGMFQQVSVDVRLVGGEKHNLVLSYVVEAPIWKPTYRVVLPEEDGDKALLQAWAVVDNTSGEDWTQVALSLTSGAPIAFRYDLHTPQSIGRPDMTSSATQRRARVAMGETSQQKEAQRSRAEMEREYNQRFAESKKDDKPSRSRRARPAPKKPSTGAFGSSGAGRGGGGFEAGDFEDSDDNGNFYAGNTANPGDAPSMDQGILLEQLQDSTQARAKASQVSGLTRFDLESKVTVPDGSSTMVAILNETVEAEQTFLYRPGGAGPGYEQNPYRVLRFKNSTPFVLEPGPISIYAGGSFVGEGISQTIATATSATIPFAVEPEIAVTGSSTAGTGASRLIKLNRGVLFVETFYQTTTTWTVKVPLSKKPTRVLIRQSRSGPSYNLKDRPEGTEDTNGAWLIPIVVPAEKSEATLKVVEQTPSRRNISIWDASAPAILTTLLKMDNLDDRSIAKIRPIVDKRREIADIDTRIVNLRKQQIELDKRARETRNNLRAIEKDARAGALRQRLTKRLEEFTREGDKLGRQIVELTSRRLEKKIEMDEALENFSFEAPKDPKTDPKKDG